MPTDLSIPTGFGPAYHGQVEALVYENFPPDEPTPTNHIRTTQDWGVQVDWDTFGPLAGFWSAEFHLQAFVEGMGTAAEMDSPPVVEDTLVAGSLVGPGHRKYRKKIEFAAGSLPAGVYKVVVLVQMYQAGGAPAYPIVASVDLPLVTLFDPA